MKKMKKGTAYTVQAALIAAIYAALTYAVAPLSFGATQFRISEALTVLPVFTPAAIPGLAIGCIIANIGSPYGPIDILLGTVATVLAALATRLTRNIKIKNIPLLSFIFPTVFNGIIIGAEITMFTPGQAASDFSPRLRESLSARLLCATHSESCFISDLKNQKYSKSLVIK